LNKESDKLVYIGKVIDIQPIEGADFIASATVVCGKGGKWKGVIRKMDIHLGDKCVVFLPDSQLNEVDHFRMSFMKDSSWRVKMRKFKGSPSEVLITEHGTTVIYDKDEPEYPVGEDITLRMKVTKYHKPVPPHLQGIAKGHFPDFIPKTDELNYQRHPELVGWLFGRAWYMTEKVDGSSTTAFRWKGNFGVCSRNLELERNMDNGYWKISQKYKLEEKLPEGIAIQWETCGPGIQSNHMGLKEIDGFVFSGYNILEKRYLTFTELKKLSEDLNFQMVKLIGYGDFFTGDGLETLGEGLYSNGNQREGVVIRSLLNIDINATGKESSPISFKVINLNYEN
jgi:RNA ligase (TIGR02306 family)